MNRTGIIILLLVVVAVAAVVLLLPRGSRTKSDLDTPTTGKLRVMVDESYKPILDTEVMVFESIYHEAKISLIYGSETDAINSLLDDSVEVIILSRSLNEKELAYFKTRQFTPKTTSFAKDALALIVHPSNPDSILTVGLVKQMMAGTKTKWSEITPANKSGNITVVFDNPGSGVARYVIDSLLEGGKLGANSSALQTNAEVINYVSSHPGAIGLIGVNWISDMDDPKAQKFLKSIRVVGIRKTEGAEDFTPHQAYLATKDYAFIRSLTIIDASARAFGLGTGFASFLASDRGQRIILKSGLLPATAPIRLVEIKK